MLLPSAFLSSKRFCFYDISFLFLTPACAVLLSCRTALSWIYYFSLSSLPAPYVQQCFLFTPDNAASFIPTLAQLVPQVPQSGRSAVNLHREQKGWRVL